MILKIIVGYIVISAIIGILYLVSGKLFGKIRERLDNKWFTYEFVLALASLLVICLLKIFYFESFSVIGTVQLLR